MKIYLILLFKILNEIYAQTGEFQGPEYIALTAQQKYEKMWPYIIQDTNQQSFYTHAEYEAGFYGESMLPTFDYEDSDQLPPGRKKMIHTVGLIGQIQWQAVEGQPYTGIFNGADYGLLRLNLAFDPSYKPFLPALSIKLFRNGFRSANIVASVSLNGQTSDNFFLQSMSNHPDLPFSGTFGNKFATVTPYINYIGLRRWATADQYGNQIPEENVVFPFEIIFQPAQNLSTYYYQGMEWYDQIGFVEGGSIPFQVYAKSAPLAEPQLIGNIYVTSGLQFSQFGDQVYFVKHNRMEYDLEAEPSWTSHLTKYTEFGGAQEYDSFLGGEDGCPFKN